MPMYAFFLSQHLQNSSWLLTLVWWHTRNQRIPWKEKKFLSSHFLGLLQCLLIRTESMYFLEYFGNKFVASAHFLMVKLWGCYKYQYSLLSHKCLRENFTEISIKTSFSWLEHKRKLWQCFSPSEISSS